MSTLTTVQQLIERAKANGQSTKKLMQSATVASGAVVGGPVRPSPSAAAPTPQAAAGGPSK